MVIFIQKNETELISKSITKFDDFPVNRKQVNMGKLLTSAFEGLKKA